MGGTPRTPVPNRRPSARSAPDQEPGRSARHPDLPHGEPTRCWIARSSTNAGAPDAPPAALSAVIVGIVREASLRPIATVQTIRDVELGADGAGSVEVSDDRVASSVEGM